MRFARVPARPAEASKQRQSTEIAFRIEGLLDAARAALGSLDAAETQLLLARAERLLGDHPELPQAAWLRAEGLSLAAELAEHTGQSGVSELRTRAAALEGPRAERFGANEDVAARAPPPVFGVEIQGLSPRDVVEWDSVAVRPPFQTAPGEHALRVLRADEVVWAGWVTVTPGAPSVELALPPLVPCSAEDLEGTRDDASGPVPPRTVRCAQWAAARVVGKGTLEVALCHGARCGAWHAPSAEPPPFEGPAQPPRIDGFPPWASFALAGVGTAAVTTVLLFATGAFHRASQPERWEYGGLQPPR